MNYTDEERKAWKESSGSPLPDGECVGTLNKVGIRTLQSGDKKLILEYVVERPLDFKDYTYDHFLSISGKREQMYYTRLALLKIGANVECELEDIEREVRNKIGAAVTFGLYTNGKYQNCNVLGTTSVPKDSGDIPF